MYTPEFIALVELAFFSSLTFTDINAVVISLLQPGTYFPTTVYRSAFWSFEGEERVCVSTDFRARHAKIMNSATRLESCWDMMGLKCKASFRKRRGHKHKRADERNHPTLPTAAGWSGWLAKWYGQAKNTQQEGVAEVGYSFPVPDLCSLFVIKDWKCVCTYVHV